MREGELYPHLRHARFEPYTVVIQHNYATPTNWLDQQARYQVDQRAVPGLRIMIPEADWEAIMEIYRAHFHAENSNPGVTQAWEQYKIMCSLTR